MGYSSSSSISTVPGAPVVLGLASVKANQTGISTEADLTGLSVSVVVPAGRYIRITGYVYQFSRTAGTATYAELAIFEGSTELSRFTAGMNNTYHGAQAVAVFSPSAGSHTYKLRAVSDGTVTLNASSLRPAFILVEDITGVITGDTFQNGITVCTSSTHPSSPSEGKWIYETDTDILRGYNGSGFVDGVPLGAWQSYTPTNTNVTVGNGTQTARYTRMGRTIIVSYKLLWGNSTSFGGTVQIGLPFDTQNDSYTIGFGHAIDVTGSDFLINPFAVSNKAFMVVDNNASSVSNTVPFTWTTSDILTFTAIYEAAS